MMIMKVTVVTILLLQLLYILVDESSQAKCSQYFIYITEPSTNEVWGQVLIPSPPRYVELHLRVSLSIAVRLSNTSNIGQIKLAQSKEDSVRAVEQGGSLLYHIRFPLRDPYPVITGLWLNNQLYCTGPHAFGLVITSYVLEHSLYPPQIPLSQNISSDVQSSQDNHNQNNGDCGIDDHQTNILRSGLDTSIGQWPWLVAIILLGKSELRCAGSLVTNRHVLTAAHCMYDGRDVILSRVIRVSLGRFLLSAGQEEGSVNREIESYSMHPDYQNEIFASDFNLAVLVLKTPAPYSSTIKPICLWPSPSDLHNVINISGRVVGWGRDKSYNPYLAESRMIKAPIVSPEICVWQGSNMSNGTFCTDLRDSSEECYGDGGSGFILHDSTTDRYLLRGVLSRIFANWGNSTHPTRCNIYYIVFVDVARHMDWINHQISIT